MNLGIIGIGSIGTNMVRRLMKTHHQCVMYDVSSVSVQTLANEEYCSEISLGDFVDSLSKPRTIWLMAPAAQVDDILTDITPHLDREDVVIDAGSTYDREDMSRPVKLKRRGVHYVHVGVEGDRWGPEQQVWNSTVHETSSLNRHTDLQPDFLHVVDLDSNARKHGNVGFNAQEVHKRSGMSGGGLKSTNSGSEHGLAAAYTEVMTIMHPEHIGLPQPEADAKTMQHRESRNDTILEDTAETWRRGSVISSWLLDMAASAIDGDTSQGKFAIRVSTSIEGRWTVIAAIDESIQAPVLAAALYERNTIDGENRFADKVITALHCRLAGYPDSASAQSENEPNPRNR